MEKCQYFVDPDETRLNDIFVLGCGCESFQACLEQSPDGKACCDAAKNSNPNTTSHIMKLLQTLPPYFKK